MPLDNCRILITGGNGQVGFELLKELSTCGAEIIVSLRNDESLNSFGFLTVKLDLEDESQIRTTVRNVKPDIIINPAAYTLVDKAESEQSRSNAINNSAVRIMAEELLNLNGAMIHFSTDYVYNSIHQHMNFESDAVSPINYYAQSKYEGEKALVRSGIPYIILRTSWVYGVAGNNFVKTMLRFGKERDSLRIVADQIGSPTSALTLAQAVSKILNQGNENPIEYIKSKSGIYNLSDKGVTNWHEFAIEIFKQARTLGLELKVQNVEAITTAQYKTPAARPLNSRLSLTKIENELHISPLTWQQSLGLFLTQILNK